MGTPEAVAADHGTLTAQDRQIRDSTRGGRCLATMSSSGPTLRFLSVGFDPIAAEVSPRFWRHPVKVCDGNGQRGEVVIIVTLEDDAAVLQPLGVVAATLCGRGGVRAAAADGDGGRERAGGRRAGEAWCADLAPRRWTGVVTVTWHPQIRECLSD